NQCGAKRSLPEGGKPKIEKNLILEILTGIKRAGASIIITYHAKEVAKWLK
ncbi:MAG: hypothetical protein HY589_00865, partial [Candidatus Omnitrophica bacterium]|nr:hypothetical protein [Candidatus Omnitrophota bacterium]